MVHRRLGRTDLWLSPIGFGAFKIGRTEGTKYARGYQLPSREDVSRLLNGVVELGINYIDTAPAYGSSEQRIGEWRSEVIGRNPAAQMPLIVSTKVGESFDHGRSKFDFSESAVRESIARSCSRLGMRQLDLVFVHSDGDDSSVVNETDVVRTLRAMRHEGDIRAIGFSGKTLEGAAAAVAGGWADAIMVEYHLEDRTHDAVIAQAAQHGVGVIVKKGLASGRLDAQRAIEFVLRNPNVTSLVIGGLGLAHMQENVELAESLSV